MVKGSVKIMVFVSSVVCSKLWYLCLIVTKLGTMVATWDSGYLVKGQGQTPGLCPKCFLLNTLWNTNLCPINAFAFLLNIILGCLSYKTKPWGELIMQYCTDQFFSFMNIRWISLPRLTSNHSEKMHYLQVPERCASLKEFLF